MRSPIGSVEHIDGCARRSTFSLVAAGGSNLTYRVDRRRRARAVALRRPPVAAVLATAHDMDREWRILDALHRNTDVPVPAPLAQCTDSDVTGAPFYVMEFVDGLILRTPAESAGFTADAVRSGHRLARRRTGRSSTRLDVDAIGLGDLARNRTNYVERQLRRWKTQVDQARVRDLPVIDEVHDALAAIDPGGVGAARRSCTATTGSTTPCSATTAASIAVLDWELATIGDPVADFAWSILYWSDPGDTTRFIDATPTLDPGLPPSRRRGRALRRAVRAGISPHLDWFTAFGYWKMGCIVEGVYARRLKGASGGMGAGRSGPLADRAEGFFEPRSRHRFRDFVGQTGL